MADIRAFAASYASEADAILAAADEIQSLSKLLEMPPEAIARTLDVSEREVTHAEPPVELAGRDENNDSPLRVETERKYRVEDVIASGGMGVVLRVWDRHLRRHLAMKMSRHQPDASCSANGPALQARFLEEAQVTGQLDHPGIVPVHELAVDPHGRVYFTMRLVRGRELGVVCEMADRFQEGWTRTAVVSVVLKACEALMYAHSKGVIHRDLKPSNIMVGRFGEVYVMDWGLARVREHDHHREPRRADASATLPVDSLRAQRIREDGSDSPLVTKAGDVVGTPAYMAPEQAGGRLLDVGASCDIYAMGAILYRVLTGRRPYESGGQSQRAADVLRLLLEGPPPAIHELRSDAPPELVAICNKAMARRVADRYSSIAGFVTDLRAYLEGRVVKAYEAGSWAEARKWVGRNRGLATAMATAMLLLVAGLGASLALLARAERSQRRALLEASRAQTYADAKALQALIDESNSLWPATPAMITPLLNWLSRAQRLADRLPAYGDELATLRARASSYDEEQRRRDRLSHPKHEQLVNAIGLLRGMVAGQVEISAETASFVDELQGTVDALEKEVAERRTWAFVEPDDEWAHRFLSELVEGSATFLNPDPTIGTIASVERRIEVATSLHAQGLDTAAIEHGWREAITSISDPANDVYDGLQLEPQLGLIPVGPDPDTGLWEFADVFTGETPRRDPQGQLVLSERSPIVFVLVPAGRVAMGAQAGAVGVANYDSLALLNETPILTLDVDAFLIAKHEITQWQWMQVFGNNPSYFPPEDMRAEWLPASETGSLRHPVESVSWLDAVEFAKRVACVLPTEAQWEYAGRAGVASPWWTGQLVLSLQDAENIADRTYAAASGVVPSYEAALEDGWVIHAPVGRFKKNAFGLYDMAGNVSEWCRDADGTYEVPTAPGDGERFVVHPSGRMHRGGAWCTTGIEARSAYRHSSDPRTREKWLGLRVARNLVR